MAPLLTIDVDPKPVLAAIDRFAKDLEPKLLAPAKETAENIVREAEARVARRTGKTAEGIGLEVARIGVGYVVFDDNPDMPGLPGWLEFGTLKMRRREYFFSSARLEEAAHERRMVQAVTDTIQESGLGD